MESKAQKAARVHWRRIAAAVLAATRRDQDLTQAQLAKKVGWTRDTIADIEMGRRKFEVGELIILAQVLRTSPEVFFHRILSWSGDR